MLSILNAMLGLSALALAGALAYAMRLSGGFRRGFTYRLPEALRAPLSVLITSLWLVVVLLAFGGAMRLAYARWGPDTDAATAITAAVTALSIFTSWNVIKACMKLRKAGV